MRLYTFFLLVFLSPAAIAAQAPSPWAAAIKQAITAEEADDTGEAMEAVESSLQLASQQSDASRRGASLALKIHLLRKHLHYPEAKALYQEWQNLNARPITGPDGDWAQDALWLLARSLHADGEPQMALPVAQRALEQVRVNEARPQKTLKQIMDDDGDMSLPRETLRSGLLILARIEKDAGQLAAAEQHARQSLDLEVTFGSSGLLNDAIKCSLLSEAVQTLGTILVAEGKHKDARALYQAQLTVCEKGDDADEAALVRQALQDLGPVHGSSVTGK